MAVSSFPLAAALAIPLLLGPIAMDAAEKFKPFKLKTVDGSPRTLADIRGKATLIGFFYPSCRFCNAAFPEMQGIYERYKEQGLAAAWINILPEEEKKIAAWQARNQSTIPVLTGASQASLQRDYKVKMTPTHYLLNAEGEVRFFLAGYRKGDEKVIEEQVRKALSAAP